MNSLLAAAIDRSRTTLSILAMVLIAGMVARATITVETDPDITIPIVMVTIPHPGISPEDADRLIVRPVETEVRVLEGIEEVTSYAREGLASFVLEFDVDYDPDVALTEVRAAVDRAQAELPGTTEEPLIQSVTFTDFPVIVISLASDTIPARAIYRIALRLKKGLEGLSEVSEANLRGHREELLEALIDPTQLEYYQISQQELFSTVINNNRLIAAGAMDTGRGRFAVKVPGLIETREDVYNLPIKSTSDTVVTLDKIATVQRTFKDRQSYSRVNGEPAISVEVLRRPDTNIIDMNKKIRAFVEREKERFPAGLTLTYSQDQAPFAEQQVTELQGNIMTAMALVMILVVAALGLRSGLLVVASVPFSFLFALTVLHGLGMSFNFMVMFGMLLGLGMLIDGAIVMIENAHKHLTRDRGKKDHWQIIYEAATEVGPALFFSLLIMTTAFLPVFALQAQEGRLFTPLAFTWTYSLMAAALLSITLVPVLMGYFIRGRILPERFNPLNLLFTWFFKPLIWLALRMKLAVIFVALALTAATWIPLERLGSEFMPPLNEGDVLYMPSTLPGISITKAKELLQQTDKIIKTFPEVHQVFGKIGRAETATDTAPLSMLETTITMKPESEWREGMTPKKLIEEMDAALKIPGVTNVWTMPIKNRIDMLSTGIKTPVGIKIAGNDLYVLEKLGKEVETLLKNVPGTMSVFSERVVGGNYFDFEINRVEASRYGLTVGDIQDVIQTAIGGMNVSTVIQGRERYPINVRYPSGLRDDWDELQRVLIPTPGGEHIPMAQVAKISIKKGPPVIKTENARLNAWVYIDLKDIDIGTYVENARRVLDEKLTLPAGYSLIWSGQYEYMERAKERLKLVVPLTLVIIFVLLYLNFQRLAETTIVMLSLPLALIGGVWVLYYLQYELSVAVAVGFIALAGVAAEIGVLILVYCNQVFENRWANGEIQNNGDVLKAVFDGTSSRIRPIMMTVISTIAGLIPIMIGSGTGSEVMKRIAAPMVGGMVSATLLNLIVLPALYAIVLQFRFSWMAQKLVAKNALKGVPSEEKELIEA